MHLSSLGQLVAGALLCFATFSALSCNSGDNEGEPLDEFGAAQNLDQLLDRSQVVVVGELVSQREEEVPQVSPVDGKVHSSRTDRVSTFRVLQRLKPDGLAEEIVEVRASVELRSWKSYESDATRQNFSVVSLSRGDNYLLFLRRFSETTGDVLGPASSVAVAHVAEGGDLRFLVADGIHRSAAVSPLLVEEMSLDEVIAALAGRESRAK